MTVQSSTTPRTSSRAGRWFRRALIALLVIANLAVFAVYWTLRSAQDALRGAATQLPEVSPELSPMPTDQEPLTFLVIGSDSREGLDDLTNFGSFEGERADVIMLVKIYPSEDRAQILSIPRDLYVPIDGHGSNRINAAYAFGGAPLMVRTVRQATGLPIHHYVEVDFVGFKAIVDEVGGITIDFPYPARDEKSGLRVEAGRQTLNGDMALAYARSRSYQELRDGSWQAVNANDIGRTQRQQQLILAILDTLKRPSTVTEAGAVVHSFASHLAIDPALAERSIVELAFHMRGIDASNIETATLPTVGDTVEGASVLRMQQPEADQVLQAFRSGQSLSAPPEGPLVLRVLNGNGVKGSAGQWSEYLAERGFEVASVGDADSSDFSETLILVPPGRLAAGEQVLTALGFGTVTTGTIEEGLDAVVIVGADAAAAASAATG